LPLFGLDLHEGWDSLFSQGMAGYCSEAMAYTTPYEG